MGQSKLMMAAGVPIMMAAAYSLYRDSHTSLIGGSGAAHKKNFERKRRSKKRRHRSRNKKDPEELVEEDMQSDEDKINISKPKNNDCSKCQLVEQKLLKYIARNQIQEKECKACRSLVEVKKKLNYCMNRDITGDIFKPGETNKTVFIEDGMRGFSYYKLFSNFMIDMELTKVEIDDPFLRKKYQFGNFMKFCETVIKTDNCVFHIKLSTRGDSIDKSVAMRMRLLKYQLKKNYSIVLDVFPVENLTTSEIRLNNGYTIKIDRGLDYFKPLRPFQIGFTDSDLRPCLRTQIELKKTYPSDKEDLKDKSKSKTKSKSKSKSKPTSNSKSKSKDTDKNKINQA